MRYSHNCNIIAVSKKPIPPNVESMTHCTACKTCGQRWYVTQGSNSFAVQEWFSPLGLIRHWLWSRRVRKDGNEGRHRSGPPTLTAGVGEEDGR